MEKEKLISISERDWHFKFGKVNKWLGKLISWPIIVVLINTFHYCFSLMHFSFETFLYIFKREQYEQNMKNLWKNNSK